MCFEIIFGALLILWGFSKILGTLFNIYIPIFGIVFGILLLYFGVLLITGNFRSHSCFSGNHDGAEGTFSTCMGNSKIHVDQETIRQQKAQLEYHTIMGNAEIDLTHLTPDVLKINVEPLIVNIDTVFGKTELKLNKLTPVRIIGKSAFGKMQFPNATSITFGTHTYHSHQNEPALMIIYASTVFGATEIGQE